MLSISGGSKDGLHSPSGLVKTQDSYLSHLTPGVNVPNGPVESTPIVFRGELLTITGNSSSGLYSNTFRIDSALDRPLRTVPAPEMGYLCAYVENEVCYVFGTDSQRQHVSMMSSSDLIYWSSPVVVATAWPGMGFYNTSVAKVANGDYVMAVECTDQGYPGIPFITRILRGSSLTSWTLDVAHFYNNGSFTNCPTIRYIDGYFYLFYMSVSNGVYYTFVSRSTDLHTWTPSNGGSDGLTIPFAPLVTEGANNSDVDFVEFNGNVYFVYARGDQASWLELSTARYTGTIDQYLAEFF